MGAICGKSNNKNSVGQDMTMNATEGNRVFIGYDNGKLYEYSINEKKIVHDFGKILDADISSMCTTSDNKHLLLCDVYCGFREFDISTRDEIINFKIDCACNIVVTSDDKFLITSPTGKSVKLTKWSIETKEQLNSWDCGIDQYVISQNCSQDNKYQFIGYSCGWLEIFDIQNDKSIVTNQVLSGGISKVAFTQDNLGAYISDSKGNINLVKWTPDASSESDFDINKDVTQVGNGSTSKICLTGDDKNLLVGSDGLVSVFNTETKKVTKEFKMKQDIRGIKLIDNGKSALIAEYSGDLTIINLETMEISSSNKHKTKGNGLWTIVLV